MTTPESEAQELKDLLPAHPEEAKVGHYTLTVIAAFLSKHSQALRDENERLKKSLEEGKANAKWIGNGNAAEMFCNKHGYDGCPRCREDIAAMRKALDSIKADCDANCACPDSEMSVERCLACQINDHIDALAGERTI